VKVLHFGNVANVPYLLAYGLEKYFGQKAYVVMSAKLPSDHKLFYGYRSGSGSGNPYKIDMLWMTGDFQSDIRSILHFIVKEQIDITHFHLGGAITANLLAKVGRCKIIRHFHGADLREMPTTQRSFFFLLGERKVLVSTPDLLAHLWNKAKSHVEWLPNPIDPLITETTEESEDESSVFLPTRHDEDPKKTSVAFEAWTYLRKLNPTVKMKTIMWGNDFPEFYERFKSDRRIVWLPVMTRQDYVKQLKSCSVVWGQFLLGIFSLIELEAMAAAKPIITYSKWHTRYSRPPPLSSHCSPESIAQITNAFLVNESARKKTGLSLREWCLSHHGLEVVCRRLHHIYREVL
jgi:hypothetical protein